MGKNCPMLPFEFKILCFSILYLITTVSLMLYTSFSNQNDNSSNIDHHYHYPEGNLQLLFTYPATYGEQKHALSASISSCNSPLFFPDYLKAHDEIYGLWGSNGSDDSHPLPVLRYLHSEVSQNTTFAGNFSTEKRKTFFNSGNFSDDFGSIEIPCGFLTEFPVDQSDIKSMEECRGVVVASAIFGDYDKIRQPRGLGHLTLTKVCFFMFIDSSTLGALEAQGIRMSKSDNTSGGSIGAWRIVVVGGGSIPMPYDNAAMNGVIPKHLIHRLFPNSRYSVWVDAKLQLTVDPLLLVHSLLQLQPSNNDDSPVFDMAVSKHPLNKHTMEEAISTARWGKWPPLDALRLQMEAYCRNGLSPWSSEKLPYTTDVPDTALIVRKHGLRSNLFSCLLFNELEGFNPRDQLAFAYIRDLMFPKLAVHMFEVETFEQIAIEYRHNLVHNTTSAEYRATRTERKRASSRGINGSSCHHYLLHMWRKR